MKPALDFKLIRELLRIAAPLILSMTGHMLMLLVDGLFLARYSPEALAAVGPASMGSFCLGSFLFGVTGYTGVMVANYIGAGKQDRTGSIVWQGIRLALAGGIITSLAGLMAGPIFTWVGHDAPVQALEKEYFRIVCLGMVGSFLGTSLSGFFTGRGQTRVVMVVQLTGFFANIVLDYLLIFGKAGLPSLGIRGAAIATVFAQFLTALVFIPIFLAAENRKSYRTWEGRKPDRAMMMRLLKFGVPNGFLFSIEIVAWTVFLMFVGRLGTSELAATTIAWRVNGFAFFPLIGLSEAVRVLAGQGHGRRDHDHVVRVTWHGTFIGGVWMIICTLIYIFLPDLILKLFLGNSASSTAPEIYRLGIVLLRFVAAYCLLDTLNIIMRGALAACGDTRWIFIASLIANMIFVALLFCADRLALGLYVEWGVATGFVMFSALLWLIRFRTGAWKHIRIVEA